MTTEDLPVFFEHQLDPEASRMAAFPARDRAAFMSHWMTNVLGDDSVIARTVLFDGLVAGNVVSWEQDGRRLVGYWIGREHWGRGVATRALSEFIGLVRTRPLYAHVSLSNVASIRVLEKCGFTASTEELSEAPDGVEELLMELPGPATPS